jgi:uncharacterized protein YcbK (DUF882 family)
MVFFIRCTRSSGEFNLRFRVQMKSFKNNKIVAAAAVLLMGMGATAHTMRAESGVALHAVSGEAGLSSMILSGAGTRYRLRLHHLHTGEDIDVVYKVGDKYVPSALAALNHFLRDHRTEDASLYDAKEFDVLHEVMAKLGKPNGVIDIVCGYRTPWSNNMLRTRAAVTGVAEHSQHMLAKAIDIRVPGVQTRKLRDVALSLHEGGVGYYPISQFVHVDVGPVRTWSLGGRGD